MTNDELQSYIDKYKKLLLESVEWWQKYSPDTKHGGYYNYLGRAGAARPPLRSRLQRDREAQGVA